LAPKAEANEPCCGLPLAVIIRDRREASDKAHTPVTSLTLIERSRSRLAIVLAGAALLLALAGTPAFAQQEPPQAAPQQAPAAETPAPPAAPPDRVGRLEQQIADLQTMVAALESLVKARPDVTLPQESAGGDANQSFGNAAGVSARIDALETQIGALTSQLELMTQQLGALEARLGGDAGAPQQLAPTQGEEPPVAPQGQEPLPELPGREGRLIPGDPSAAAYADAGGGKDMVCATHLRDQARGEMRKAGC
jgi:TolA-binding protein